MPRAKGSESRQLHATLKPTHSLDIVKHVPILLYMTEENDNAIADFTAYKMRSIVKQLAMAGRTDLAHGMQLALDQYLLGNIDIDFRDGMPYVASVNAGDT